MFATDPDTARGRAIEWLQKEIVDMSIGDTVWIPDGETGDLQEFTKEGNWLS